MSENGHLPYLERAPSIPSANGGVRSATKDEIAAANQPRRTLLVVSLPGAVSASLVHAVEREFPWVVVRQVEDVAAACAPLDHPVALILIDAPLLADAESLSNRFRRSHPHAIAALIEHDSHDQVLPSRIVGSPLIRGVLPMNLRLDIWLSVVRLMLCGGEYFPARMVHASSDAERLASPGVDVRVPTAAPGRTRHLEGLTSREFQILELVSRGLQNKSIAAEFSLSEHTVKIHLHNIIAKLGVHNRTEAAARFRERPVATEPAR